jgi:hypothetical protein
VAISAQRSDRCRGSLDCRCTTNGPDIPSRHEKVASALSCDVSRGIVDDGVEEVTVVGHLATGGLLQRDHLAVDPRRRGRGRDKSRPEARKYAVNLRLLGSVSVVVVQLQVFRVHENLFQSLRPPESLLCAELVVSS